MKKQYTQEEVQTEDSKDTPDAKIVGHLPHWQQAAKAEVDRLVSTGALEPVDTADLTDEQKTRIVSSTMALKRKSDGRHKGRLCGRGFEADAFYDDAPPSWSPCPRMSTVRIILTLIFSFTLKSFCADITQAYTQSEMVDTLFISPPAFPILSFLPSNYVWRVRRSLYGFRQAGHNWWKKLQHILSHDLGYKQSTYDPCLYFLPGCMCYVLFYVDDLLIVGTDAQIEAAVQGLQRALPNSVTGSYGIRKYLGFRICEFTSHVIINASDFIRKCLNKFRIIGTSKIPWSSVLTPRADSELKVDQSLYRSIIGSLTWIATIARPDISAVTHHPASFSHDPCRRHLEAAS